MPLEASGSILPTRTNVGGLAGGGGVGSALENEETLTNALVSSLLFPTDLTKLCPSTTALQQSTDPSSADPSSSSSSSAPSSSFSSVLGFAAISDFGLSEILRLPGSFGAIYLGETFSSYICINNESQLAIQNVGIKAELQTSTQRFTLADTSSSSPASQAGRGGGGPTAAGSGTMTPNYANSGQPSSIVSEVLQDMPASSPVHSRVSLLPSQSAEYIVHHEIKELGEFFNGKVCGDIRLQDLKKKHL